MARAGLERLFLLSTKIAAAKARGGFVGRARQAGYAVAGALTFARLYLLPTVRHPVPQSVRMQPAW